MPPRTAPKHWILNPSDELAVKEGCSFDESAGADVCEFLETFCWASKGKQGPAPLALFPWEIDFVCRLFGWKRPDGTRRFQHFYLEIGKKNGKSTLLSGLTLEELLATPAGAPEIYINACDKEQAGIIFGEAERMRKASPELRNRLRSKPSTKRIFNPANDGVLIANSSEVANKDGFNPTLTIFDELHRQGANRQLWEVFEYASAAREEPLTGALTTAGEDCKGVWFEQRDYAEKVNRGEIADTAFLGIVYRADPEDDFEDPAVWRKANPTLGTLIDPERFGRELAKAKQSAETWANFLRLRLNVVTNADRRFIRLDRWDECDETLSAARYRERLARFEGRPCFAGLDLAATTDLAAYARLFPEDGILYLFLEFWCPGSNPSLRERHDQVSYRSWARDGWISLTEGDVIDYAAIEATVENDLTRFDLRRVLADPWNATKSCQDLRSKGVPVEFLRQGFVSLSGPTKELERQVLGKSIRHGGHPVLRWNATNAIAERDAAGNVKLSKAKSAARIDGLAAAVNALAGYLSDPDSGHSVYQDRGLLIL